MNLSENKEFARIKDSNAFIFKWTCVQCAFPLLSAIVFKKHMQQFFNDHFLVGLLLLSILWNLCGICICLYNPIGGKRIAREVEKFMVLLIFFAPTTCLFLFGPMIENVINGEFKEITEESHSRSHYDDYFGLVTEYIQPSGNFVASPDSKPIFFARYDIAKNTYISIRDIKVMSYEPGQFKEAIIATKENWSTVKGSGKSILDRKAIKEIRAGQPIRNFDIEPPFN